MVLVARIKNIIALKSRKVTGACLDGGFFVEKANTLEFKCCTAKSALVRSIDSSP